MKPATRNVIDYFEQINRIPRCSKHEQQISRWLQQWAADRALTINTDAVGNLVMRVPASAGCEQAPTVVLQGHMDMVCEKDADSNHDFTTDPIRMVQDGDWLRAVDTTLGADNGIALALTLALVDSPDIAHPPLELFFTVDEETGLTGAMQMDPSLLSGRILVNLDSEDEGVFVVGCAGGRSTTITQTLDTQHLGDDHVLLKITVAGMQGGHSGVDIAKHRANANKIMARLLGACVSTGPTHLIELAGGSATNVIPRTSQTLIACGRERVAAVKNALDDSASVIRWEFQSTEPDMTIHIDEETSGGAYGRGITESDTAKAVDLLMALPSGPVEMEFDDPLLVRTSVNLSIVRIKSGKLAVTSSQRSSMPSRLDAICKAVEAMGRLSGARVQTSVGYPSWPMNPESKLLQRCTAVYRELFAGEPVVRTMHAGLECGVIGDRCPGMDMISLGPTLQNPHSPSERLYLPSVEKVWTLLVGLLASYEMAPKPT
jgi:dipeptidase D